MSHSRAEGRVPRPDLADVAFAAYALLFLAFAAAVGSWHDYGAYIAQWQAILDGQDPWLADIGRGRNAYGPLHVLFAPLAAIHPLLPKLVFVAAWLGAVHQCLRSIREMRSRPLRIALIAALLFNPFVWIWVGLYGSNDAFVGALVALVVAAAMRGRRGPWSGIIVALAGLLKIYPIFFLPFLSVDRGRVLWRVLLVGAMVFLLGWAIAFAVWGPSAFASIEYAAFRKAKLLSLASFLIDSDLIPFSGRGYEHKVVQWSRTAFGVVGVACFLWHWRRRQSLLRGAVLFYLVVLTFYHLGNYQFYIAFLPAAVLFMAKGESASARLPLLLVILVVSVLGTGFHLTDWYAAPPFQFVHKELGLLVFLLDAWALLAVLGPWRRAANAGTASARRSGRSGAHPEAGEA